MSLTSTNDPYFLASNNSSVFSNKTTNFEDALEKLNQVSSLNNSSTDYYDLDEKDVQSILNKLGTFLDKNTEKDTDNDSVLGKGESKEVDDSVKNIIKDPKKSIKALGLPSNFNLSIPKVHTLVPNFGDFTGLTSMSVDITVSGLYKQLQQLYSVQNYLDSTDCKPAGGFSYIKGRPAYKDDTPEGKKMQDQVFAALKNEILNQLTKLIQQIDVMTKGLQQQQQMAESFRKFQDSAVAKAIKKASGGGNA